MAEDNKPMKYMRYAVGEIVLAVFGIVITSMIMQGVVLNDKNKNC